MRKFNAYRNIAALKSPLTKGDEGGCFCAYLEY